MFGDHAGHHLHIVRLFILAPVLSWGCGESSTEVGRDCRIPRIVSAIVFGRVSDAVGDSLPGARVMIEVNVARTPADTVGECMAFDSFETPAAVDSAGRFREKVGSVFSGFVCARARGELNGATGVSKLTKLELRGDGGPECTPESSLDSGALDIVIG